jgi:transcriptional regulator with XRE-family HTH domain
MIEGLDKRLQHSRLNAGLSRSQIARLLDVSDSLIGLYETGVRQPSLATLIKLSSIYKVSTDYLLGCENTATNHISTEGLSAQQIKALKMTIECFRNK